MAKKSVTLTVRIEGLRETLRAFQDLPKDASTRLREESLKLAEKMAAKARADGMTDQDPRSKLLAGTVKAVKDRVPVIQVGGDKLLGRHGAPAYSLLFGSLFGMNARSGWYAKTQYKTSHGHQYREHRGRDAYWFFNVIERDQATISRAWNTVADGIVRDFSEGG